MRKGFKGRPFRVQSDSATAHSLQWRSFLIIGNNHPLPSQGSGVTTTFMSYSHIATCKVQTPSKSLQKKETFFC